jgi:hypothetical protein
MDHVPDKLISAYLEGALDEQQAEELSRWVLASKDHAIYLASLTAMEHGLVRQLKAQSNHDILAELQQDEEVVPASPPIYLDATKLTKQKYVAALSYVLEHTFTPKRIAMLATAAALLLGAVLAIVLLTGPDENATFVEVPDSPAPGVQPPSLSPVVATLTASQNAQWLNSAEGALAPGTKLRVGDRLALTAGFAQITTARGAIAIIEAPATIELTDSDNALHLHTGKLVGICETPSSKGFLVSTPHMDITDLGTRFGVSVDPADNSIAQVFEGEVTVADANGAIAGRSLKPSESIAFDVEGREVPLRTRDAEVFASLTARMYGIVEMSDSITVVPTRQAAITDDGGFNSDSQFFVFPELTNAALPADLGVTITEPGRYDQFLPENAPSGVIPAETTVRSFVVRLSPTGKGTRLEGRLTFDAPILGVMTDASEHEAFESASTLNTTRLIDPPREFQGLEGIDFIELANHKAGTNDSMTLSQDRKTLELRCYVHTGADHLRILVEMPDRGSGTVR